MFYVPVMNNGEQLDKLFDFVEQYKDKISGREVGVRVDGYYISTGSKAEEYGTARTRSNRVKSELIVRKGLKEDNFVTRNQGGSGNYVTVRLFDIINEKILSPSVPVAESPGQPVAAEDTARIEAVPETAPVVVPVEAEVVEVEQPATAPVETPAEEPRQKADSPFALKTNLLDYAILMPNIEAEWMFSHHWSVALEWQGAWYAKNNPRKVYRVSTVIPEVRYWVIDRARWHGMYVGVFAGGARYDLSNDSKGHEGEGVLAGASVGYMWPIGKHLSLDAGIGLGYMRLRDKKYLPEDGHFLYQYTKNINYFGPLRLKLSLVWRIPM